MTSKTLKLSIIKKFNLFCVTALLCIMINYNLGEMRYYFAFPMLLVVWFLFFLDEGIKLDKILTKYFIISALFWFLLGVPSLLDIQPHKSNMNYTFVNYTLSIFFKLFVAYSIIMFLHKWKLYAKVLNKTLLINLIAFYFQFFMVYLTGYYPDFLEFITGQSQKYNSLFSIPILGSVYRPTGFYEEPSTYSSIILILIGCRLFISPKIDKIITFSLLSIVLSLSVASMVYGGALGVYLLVRSKGSYYKYIPFLLLPFVVYALFSLANLRLGSVGNATEIRNNLFYIVFEQNVLEILFGNGALGTITSLAQFVIDGNLWKAGVVTLNDNGLWLFIIIKFGVLGLLMFIVFFVMRLKSKLNIVVFIIILLTKASFLYFIFIFYFGTVYFLKGKLSRTDYM